MPLFSWWRNGIPVTCPMFLALIDGYLGGRTRGFAFWPFIVLREPNLLHNKPLINHERIHLAQERDGLILGMFALYFAETLWARVVLRKSAREAYFWLSAEQEAYLNQHNLNYLATRRWGAQFRYIFHKKRFRIAGVLGDIEYY